MTTERTRAALALMLTFTIGIVIGVFIPGLVWKARFAEYEGRVHEHELPRMKPPSGDRFERAIYRIIDPDSIQEEKIKSSSLIHNTTTRIASIHRVANHDIKLAMDSLITDLVSFKGLLRDDQKKRLEEFEKHRMVEVPAELGRSSRGRRGFGPGSPQERREGHERGSRDADGEERPLEEQRPGD
jgi:hypothetical protein